MKDEFLSIIFEQFLIVNRSWDFIVGLAGELLLII